MPRTNKINKGSINKRPQTCALTAIALFSGTGERAPHGPLKDNNKLSNEIEQQNTRKMFI